MSNANAITVEFVIKTVKKDSSYEIIELGKGHYAHVYEAVSRILIKSENPEEKKYIEEIVAAKVYNDGADRDYENVFAKEVEVLTALSLNDHVVGLHGIVENCPPTFYCRKCGQVFHVTQCPMRDCHGLLETGDENRISLRCKADQKHTFFRNSIQDCTHLFSNRTCDCTSDCGIINFLYRPYIFLDALDLNLQEFNEVLRKSSRVIRERKISFPSNKTQDELTRYRFLLSISCLCEAAEGLAFAHRNGKLHCDLSPENIMVALIKENQQFGPIPIRTAQLVDFGQARSSSDLGITKPMRRQELFSAPETQNNASNIAGDVEIEIENAPLPKACLISPVAYKNRLLQGDTIKDNDQGIYIIRSEESSDDIFVTYSLEVISPPKRGAGKASVPIVKTECFAEPGDIFAFGCVIAWLFTGGALDQLQIFRNAAERLTLDGTGIESPEQLLENIGTSLRGRLLDAIQLPITDADQEFKRQILFLIFRCLVRGRGAYAVSRVATAGQCAADELARDLRSMLNNFLHFYHSFQSYTEWSRQSSEHFKSIELNSRTKINDLLNKNDKLIFHISKYKKILIMVILLCFMSTSYMVISIWREVVHRAKGGEGGRAEEPLSNSKGTSGGSHPPTVNGPPAPAASGSAPSKSTLTPNTPTEIVQPAAKDKPAPSMLASPSVQASAPPEGPSVPVPTKHRGKITALAFSFDGQLLYSGDEQGSVFRWHTAQTPPHGELLLRYSGPVQWLALSPQNDKVFVGGAGTSQLLVAENMQQAIEVQDVSLAAFSPDGDLLAIRSGANKMVLWKTPKSGKNIFWCSQDGVSPSQEINDFSFENKKSILLLSGQRLERMSVKDCMHALVQQYRSKQPAAVGRTAIAHRSSSVTPINGEHDIIALRRTEYYPFTKDPSRYGNSASFRFFGDFMLAWTMDPKISTFHAGIVKIAEDSSTGDEYTGEAKPTGEVIVAALAPNCSRIAIGNNNATISIFNIIKDKNMKNVFNNQIDIEGEPIKQK